MCDALKDVVPSWAKHHRLDTITQTVLIKLTLIRLAVGTAATAGYDRRREAPT
jgi:hypothetical protein